MVNFQKIKEYLNEDHIIEILLSFNVDIAEQNSKHIIFYSICHHENDFENHKPKLYYYIETKSFYCFACGFSGDIFTLIQHIKKCNLIDSVKYICSICHIQENDINEDTTIAIDDWQSMKKFLPTEKFEEQLKQYNKSVLKLFDPIYHQSWIEDGISVQSMIKFHIGWYGKNQQITIPVFDIDGNLVGIHGRNTKTYLVEKGLKYQPVKTLNEEYKFPTGKILYGLYENQKNIIETKEVILVEAPKSVLQAEDILPVNNAVALFGWNCQAYRRDLLLKLGINHVIIGLDKQFEEIDSDEYNTYIKQVKKIIKLFQSYCKVSILFDKCNVLKYKDSPFDEGKEKYNILKNDMITM